MCNYPGDSAYPIWPYLIKNYNIYNLATIDKNQFDVLMNVGQVMIENAFGAFKNQCWIFKDMLVHANKTPHIIMACCVLHNFCGLHGIFEPIVRDIRECDDPLIGFDKVNCAKKGKQTKTIGELLRDALFASWLDWHPIV